MVLGEQYLQNILRPPPTNVGAVPPNPLHPFQSNFMYYLRKRFIPHHAPLVYGYIFSIFCFSSIDAAMKNAQANKYEAAIKEGKAPCE